MIYDPTKTYELNISEVEYQRANGVSWLARICQPKGQGPFPALLFVHGGAWSAGDRNNNTWLYEPLAASGLVVISIDFRLAPDHPYPEPLEDINFAARWAKVHASEFNADPATLGGLGSSSGGHQVMLTAMRPSDPRYAVLSLPEGGAADAAFKYIIGCWPILDPYARYLFAQDTGRPELVARSEGYFGSVEAMQEGNPQFCLDRGEVVRLPPTLIIQGTADTNVTPDMQRRFAEAFRKAGGECQLEIFEGMPHGTTIWPDKERAEAIERIKAFIARELLTDRPADAI